MPRTEIARQLVSTPCSTVSHLSTMNGARQHAAGCHLDRGWQWRDAMVGFAVRDRGDSAALLSDLTRSLTKAVRRRVTRTRRRVCASIDQPILPPRRPIFRDGCILPATGRREPRRALKSFQRAIEADPGYGAAHASAAFAYVKLASFAGISHSEARVRRGRNPEGLMRAVEDIAEAHAAEADLRFLYDWDWEGAEREFREPRI